MKVMLLLSLLKLVPERFHKEITACVYKNRVYDYNFKLMKRFNFCKEVAFNNDLPEEKRKYVHTSNIRELEVDTL